MPEKFGEMYSYSACLVNCRMNSMKSLCKCTPYYMPSDAHERVCTIHDLQCLNKYKEKLTYIYPVNALDSDGMDWELQNSLYCPDCLPDCELTHHRVQSFKTSLTIEENHKNKAYPYSIL
ncbi:hypothetical protein O3G_MSEX014609 [Manduca sexta]|uniref:Uncharacterized protein n=2 Tax=Manduca sexta TaxID=7130 RepID=A0A922CZU5_MANSE|nr:hypothetical protein O3G_MSEX014609 [Manduca sexta]